MSKELKGCERDVDGEVVTILEIWRAGRCGIFDF
jgi:hypothetical protein